MSTAIRTVFLALLLSVSCIFLSSCTSSLTSTLIGPALDNMQQQSDIELVCEGTPSYLLMIDSLIAGDPDNQSLLTLGIKGYSGYIGAITECSSDVERIAAMADKAYGYSQSLLKQRFGLSPNQDLDTFTAELATLSSGEAPYLFWTALGWTMWIQQQQGAPAAMAGLSKIEKMLLKVVELDEKIQTGTAHFLLGGYYGSRPALLGGKPDKSRYHFERALELSGRKMLIVQTVFAETYCRNTMNRTLHDALLDEVMKFSLQSYPPNTLTNQIAKRRAARLLQDGFFDE